HAHHAARAGGGQLPVGGVPVGADGQVVGETLYPNRVIEGCQNSGNLLQQIEGIVVRQRVAAGEKQARIQLDFHPEFVTAHGELVGADQIGKGFTHALHDAFQRIVDRKSVV